tara:strand:- start:9779 stop:9979 length:201 start_codon:yes stop_codon:yes gene_type:complete
MSTKPKKRHETTANLVKSQYCPMENKKRCKEEQFKGCQTLKDSQGLAFKPSQRCSDTLNQLKTIKY